MVKKKPHCPMKVILNMIQEQKEKYPDFLITIHIATYNINLEINKLP